MGWIRGLGNRLGYGGRSDRREFVAGAALTVVGPYALSLAIKGSINTLFAVFPRTVALILALVLTVMVCAAIVAWFWGWSALLTRRARDVGLPAWAGLASLFVLWAAMTGLKGFAPPDIYGWINFLACMVFALVWSVWPSAGGSWAPGRSRATLAHTSAEPA
jgi:uncharacterized membrane protein YhaH (DUF805 family)